MKTVIRETIKLQCGENDSFALRELLAEIQELCDKECYKDIVVKFEEL